MADFSLERSAGRQEFLKYVKGLIKDKEHFVYSKTDRLIGVTKHIYSVISKMIKKQLKVEIGVQLLNELAFIHHDIPSIILDIFGIFDAETTNESDERKVFCQLVKDTEGFLSENLLKERMEIDTLQDVGTVKNRIFYTRFIKVKTKLYYKQRRFNLFREESEGYAKLITELNQDHSDNFSALDALEIIKSLIGCFNLDPNRVLDIIIESYEMHPDRSKLFVPLLQSYVQSGSVVCEVLGYKFRHFSEMKNTPTTLFNVTALLLQHDVFKFEEIYTWLSPDDTKIISDWKQELQNAKEYVRKLNIVSINKEKETEDDEKIGTFDEKYSFNQKWRLCEALLDIGDWENAQKLIKKLPDHSVLVNECVAKALCKLINTIIDPLYRLKCPTNQTPIKERRGPEIYNLQIPLVTNVSKLKHHVIPMCITLGPSLYTDPVLLHKIVNLMKSILQDMKIDSVNPVIAKGSENESLYYDILSLLDAAVLPALSYMDCNCCIAEEIWEVLKMYPYQLRYSLYGRWKNDTYQIHPMLIRRRGQVQKHIKAIMKRVSKENVKPVGRQIGKLSHCSPGFLFDYILLQIQIYDNLIGPVVESLRYLTSLSYDILGYCLIETLAQADRARLESDGTSLSLWLQSLANFCGAVFKKYNIELCGLLQYVGNQLKAQKSLDLLILKEICQKMTGIEAAEEMTSDQVKAMCGGEILRNEAGYFSQVRNTKKSSQRLKDALACNDLAVALALLIAQQKHCVIYRETTHSHLKLVGKLYDQCQDTLVQFGTFLGLNYSVEEYIERLPSIHAMLQEYHIHSDVAFFLARPMFSHAINQKYDQLRKSDSNGKKITTSQKLDKYMEATLFVMEPIANSVLPLHPAKVWEDISPQFLCTFWSLSMYDLQVPTDSYTKEINKIKQLSLAVMDNKDNNSFKNKKEQERYIALMEKLQDERKKQQEHVDKTLHRLSQEKDSWFLSRSLKSAKNETITQFLQLCLFPRCTFTALDAIYCAKFVQIIHSLKTTNFSTLLCYDRIFCDITLSVTSCTENEAGRYGRFLCAMLETVMRWHLDEQVFQKECANYPGFVTKFRVSNTFSDANDHVGYENYRHVCHKWHYKITKALVFCLDSKDYMQIRNALIILMRILPHFPVLAKLSQIIERKVDKVREEEKNKRQDLFVLASSYIGQLKAKTSQMMRESDFHQVPNDKATVVVMKQEEKKVALATSDVVKSDSNKKETIITTTIKEPVGVAPKIDKKAQRQTIKAPSPQPQVIDLVDNREGNGQDRIRKERSLSPVTVRDATAVGNRSVDRLTRDTKRSERREKDRDEDRKRDKERRRNKRDATSPPYDASYYRTETESVYQQQDGRVRERDLSSVSNSSNGSPARARSMEPPTEPIERDLKRRKVELKKANTEKRDKIKTPKKEKLLDDTKEQRREKRKKDRNEEVTGNEKRSRKEEDKQHKNGDEPSLRVSKHHHVRDNSPVYDEPREKPYKSGRRGGY